jgi:hypothetical protein
VALAAITETRGTSAEPPDREFRDEAYPTERRALPRRAALAPYGMTTVSIT